MWLPREIRYGLRLLRRSPGFSASVVAVLALGIAANMTIFNLVEAVMLRDLPVMNPQELVVLRWSSPQRPPKDVLRIATGPQGFTFSYPAFRLLESRNDVLSSLFGFTRIGGAYGPVVAAISGHTMQVTGVVVAGSYFPGLGIEPIFGRFIGPADDSAGAAPVIDISYDFWAREFSGDPGAVGRTIYLNGQPFAIVGVTPSGFTGTDPGWEPDLWEPLGAWEGLRPSMTNMAAPRTSPDVWWLSLMGRLQPGVRRQRAADELNSIFRESFLGERSAAAQLAGLPRLELATGARGLSELREMFFSPLLALMAVVALALLVSCADVATLMLARGHARSREIAIRLSLGAPRSRLLAQVSVEALLLAGGGALLGFALAWWASMALGARLSGLAKQSGLVFPRLAADPILLGFSAVVALFVAVAAGVVPAALTVRASPASSLKEGGITPEVSGRLWRARLSGGLVVTQVALSILIVVAAGLFLETIGNLQAMDLGFDPRGLFVFNINAAKDGYTGSQLTQLYEQVARELQGIPGVIAASASTSPPFSWDRVAMPITVEDARGGPETAPMISINMVGPDYFGAAGVVIRQGRGLMWSDVETEQMVVVINHTMARDFFGPDGPLGHVLNFGTLPDPKASYTIVGVAKDTASGGLREKRSPIVYVPFSSFPGLFGNVTRAFGMSFEIRARISAEALLPAVRSIVHSADPNLRPASLTPEMQPILDSLARERLSAQLSALLGLFVILLTSVSVYATQSYMVTRRTRELGIRKALGAQDGALLRMVWKQSLLLALVGIALGVPAALAVTRFIAGQLYGVKPGDPMTIIVSAALVAAAAMLGGLLPARRATRVYPASALRYE